MGLRERIEGIWYGGEPAPWWLLMLVPLYRALVGLRRLPCRLGLLRPARIAVPVICVGNLVAGGSGKTPLVIALVDALRARGWQPGVVSRGYGGSAREARLLGPDSTPAEVGDEPVLIARRTGAAVAVGRDRAQAARLLLAQGVDLVLADDGLQNPGFVRDVEICVVDGRRRFGNGRLLPAGPLREPATRFAEYDFRVCNGGQTQQGEIPMQLEGSQAIALAGDTASRPLASFSGTAVHAVAAIGDPQRFFDALRGKGIELIAHAFADHHAFVPSDLEFGNARPVLMTEKDAVKCLPFARAGQWFVPVTASLPASFFDAIAARLQRPKAS